MNLRAQKKTVIKSDKMRNSSQLKDCNRNLK